jgi:hypothetical protein
MEHTRTVHTLESIRQQNWLITERGSLYDSTGKVAAPPPTASRGSTHGTFWNLCSALCSLFGQLFSRMAMTRARCGPPCMFHMEGSSINFQHRRFFFYWLAPGERPVDVQVTVFLQWARGASPGYKKHLVVWPGWLWSFPLFDNAPRARRERVEPGRPGAPPAVHVAWALQAPGCARFSLCGSPRGTRMAPRQMTQAIGPSHSSP